VELIPGKERINGTLMTLMKRFTGDKTPKDPRHPHHQRHQP
jgi:hypothetical protein